MEERRETATLAGGCFWCLEAVYDEIKGIEDVVSGYAGGSVRIRRTSRSAPADRPRRGGADQVRPRHISFSEILDVFFTIHDPTTLNRQGNDVGTQYRSAIFYHSPEQEQTRGRRSPSSMLRRCGTGQSSPRSCP